MTGVSQQGSGAGRSIPRASPVPREHRAAPHHRLSLLRAASADGEERGNARALFPLAVQRSPEVSLVPAVVTVPVL